MINPSVSHLIFDWGDTIMKDDASRADAMYLWPKVELMEQETRRVLAWLSRTYTLVLATSAAASDETMVRKALARVEVDGYFSEVFTAKRTGVPKTNILFWRAIMKELNVGADRLMMVGDGFEGDVRTPVRLGIQAIWYNPNSCEQRSGQRYGTIHSLSELAG